MIHFTRSVFRAVGMLVSIIVWICFGLALLSPYISPQLFSWSSLLNLAFPLLLLAMIVLLAAYLLSGKWIMAGIYILLLGLSYRYTSTYLPLNKAEKQTRKDLRILSYNVMGFSKKEGNTILAIDLIKRYDPDIICLQEGILSANTAQNNKRLRLYFGEKWPYVDTYHLNDGISRGIALLSKYPIIAKEGIRYPSEDNGSCMYVLEVEGGKKLLLVNNHLESYKLTSGEKSSYKERLKNNPFRSIMSVAADLKKRLGPSLRLRAKAARKVRQKVNEYQSHNQPDYIVICGDLNDTPMSYAYSNLRNNLEDAFAEKGHGRGISFNERFFPFRIDHLFHNTGLQTTGVLIPTHPECSDHNPLIVDLTYRKE